MIYRLHTSKAFCTSQKLKINFIHKGKVTLRRFGWCTDTSYRPTNDAPLWQVHEVAKSRRLTALALPVNTRKQITSKMKLHFFLYFLKNYDCIIPTLQWNFDASHSCQLSQLHNVSTWFGYVRNCLETLARRWSCYTKIWRRKNLNKNSRSMTQTWYHFEQMYWVLCISSTVISLLRKFPGRHLPKFLISHCTLRFATHAIVHENILDLKAKSLK